MFVRNNRGCPNCGKTQFTDLSATSRLANVMYFRVECSECLAFFEIGVDLGVCEQLILVATESLPPTDRRRRAHNWAPSSRITASRVNAIERLCLELFEMGLVDWKFAELPCLQGFISLLRGTSGVTDRPCIILRRDWLASGQPLAS